jgi:hypothetical protein
MTEGQITIFLLAVIVLQQYCTSIEIIAAIIPDIKSKKLDSPHHDKKA